jgi:hypothetical protein
LWVHDLISANLPGEYKDIKVFADILPLNDVPVTYPFPGFVLNIQVATVAHLDGGDESSCVVIPSGTFTGGQLILYEAGLVLDLKAGDVVIFPSFKLTHFNLHFRGSRYSVVMHVDKEGKEWVNGRRGWQFHLVV